MNKKGSNPAPPLPENQLSTINNHIGKLGYEAVDVVTGCKGIIECITFDLYGCIQAILKSKVDKDGKIPEGKWFDISRLEITSKETIMDIPNFSKGYVAEGMKGAAEKPSY